jgi:hypothetical protein
MTDPQVHVKCLTLLLQDLIETHRHVARLETASEAIHGALVLADSGFEERFQNALASQAAERNRDYSSQKVLILQQMLQELQS